MTDPLDLAVRVTGDEYSAEGVDRLRRIARWSRPHDVASICVCVERPRGDVEREFTEADVHCRVVEARGRKRFVDAVRSIARGVEAGRASSDEVVSSHLDRKVEPGLEPDIFVQTGIERLSDALLWQSVYSELRYVDSWLSFDRDELDGLLEDYEESERRFGR
ncbi:MAG: undecaprenyl diphosphate synthase family protein [Halobacteriales archaeon]